MVAFIIIITFVILRYNISFWKKVALMLLTSIVLQQSSFDYKLINIFVPFMLFLNSDETSKYNRFYMIVFALLLIPKDYVNVADTISISVILNPLLIMSIIVTIIFEAIQSKSVIEPSYYFSSRKLSPAAETI